MKIEAFTYREDFGRKLRAMRRYRRLSQETLALMCSITQQHLSKLEQGKCYPSIGIMVLIADALECEVIFHLKPREEL